MRPGISFARHRSIRLVIEKDRLVQPVRLDVGNKSTEFGALN